MKQPSLDEEAEQELETSDPERPDSPRPDSPRPGTPAQLPNKGNHSSQWTAFIACCVAW